MDRKGVSHIEVILAFILFIGSIVTMLYFFNPVNANALDNAYPNEVYNHLKTNLSVPYLELGIRIQNLSSLPAANLNVVSIDLNSTLDIQSNISVKDLLGNRVNSRIEKPALGIFCFDVSSANNFIIAGIAEGITSPPYLSSHCPAVNETFYQIGSTYSRKILSEKRLIDLNASYYANYNSLRESIGLPANKDFNLKFTFSDGSIIYSGKLIPKGVQVNSINYREEMLITDGSIQFVGINIQTW